MLISKHVVCVEIGGTPISLSTDDKPFFDLVEQRYESFLSTAQSDAHLEFEIVPAAAATDADVRVLRNGSEWQISRGDFLARWDARTRAGFVRQNANPYSLDSVLRILHSLILAEQRGFLLHAASGICEGRAYLFSGVSGAGKTTMTRIAPPDVCLLTDEISYVRRRDDAYLAFGTPFAGELAKAGENCSAPISCLYFLEKGPENRVEELPAPEAVRRLMRNILFFAEDPQLVDRLLQSACEFVDRVPTRRLTFYPDKKVWDYIRQVEGVALDV